MQTLGGQSVKYQYADYFEASYVSPKLIVFSAKAHGENIGFYTLGGEHREVYASLLPFYDKLFSAEGVMTPLSDEDGAALFEELMAGDHIYIAYENDLPKDLIYAMSSENVVAATSSEEYIREIMIVPGIHLYDGVSLVPSGMQVYTSVYAFYAVARDSLGNYYCYTTDYVPSSPSDISFNTNFYLTYTTTESHFLCEPAGLYELDSYFVREGFEEKVTDTTVILRDVYHSLPHHTVSASSYHPGAAVTNKLLGALLMNPEKVTSFTDASGVRFYYDEGRNASISPYGRLEYPAHGEEGLPLSDLFEYPTANEDYDLRDYVGASLLLARSLETAAGAGAHHRLFLSGVYAEENTVKVSIGYSVKGLPLYFQGLSEVIGFVFEDGMLKKVSYDLRSVAVSEGAPLNIDMVWALRTAVAESNAKHEYAYGYLFRLKEESVAAELVGREP
jgi:hypothetical protein